MLIESNNYKNKAFNFAAKKRRKSLPGIKLEETKVKVQSEPAARKKIKMEDEEETTSKTKFEDSSKEVILKF